MHLGNGRWAVVDSCEDENGHPLALRYLEALGVDPARSVILIVTTHWHDDHIRGMGQLVQTCEAANFSCASVLTSEEFMQTVRALDDRHDSGRVRSGLRELHTVLVTLRRRRTSPIYASPNRVILSESGCCIRSLSPSDSMYLEFLRSIAGVRAPIGQSKNRIPALRPNQVSVALWVTMDNTAAVLGADLERLGWKHVLALSARPRGLASVFKVPHHGAANAHEPRVWTEMLEKDVHAVLTPWTLGGQVTPTRGDARRILSCSKNAYATANVIGRGGGRSKRPGMVDRTLAESRAVVRRPLMPVGTVRLRKEVGSDDDWSVERLSDACHLRDYLTGWKSK